MDDEPRAISPAGQVVDRRRASVLQLRGRASHRRGVPLRRRRVRGSSCDGAPVGGPARRPPELRPAPQGRGAPDPARCRDGRAPPAAPAPTRGPGPRLTPRPPPRGCWPTHDERLPLPASRGDSATTGPAAADRSPGRSPRYPVSPRCQGAGGRASGATTVGQAASWSGVSCSVTRRWKRTGSPATNPRHRRTPSM